MSPKDNADYLLKQALDHGITDTRKLANFMGQMQVESGGFSRMNENLSYSSERLLDVFPGRNGMNTLEQANAVAAGGSERSPTRSTAAPEASSIWVIPRQAMAPDTTGVATCS
ncbi:MAG: hypothetical protein ABI767_00085 [Rhodanobacter sp.]